MSRFERPAPTMSSALTIIFAAVAFLAPQVGTEGEDLRSRPASEGTTRIEVSFFLLDLSDVDGATQSFEADVVVSSRWHDPRLAGVHEAPTAVPADQVWDPRLTVVNRRSIDRTLPEVMRVYPDGAVRYTQRFIGTFSANMNLREFPLDRQRFYVHIVTATGADEAIELVAGEDEELISGQAAQLSISDWRIGPTRVEISPLTLTPDGLAVPGIAMIVDGERELSYYIVQVMLPLMMIVTMAWTVFWIDPSVVPTRMGVVVTTMLTLIAYRFALSNLVPRLPYLTRLDWFMLGSTSLILGTLLTMAATAYMRSQGREEAVEKIDRRGRVVFAIVAIVVWTVPWLA